jgi:UrcA family protein
MFMSTKIVLCGLAVSSLALASTALFADDAAVQIDHVTVSSAGLDLNRPSDVAKLYNHLRFAADQVCGPRNITGSYYTWSGYTSCASAAMQNGVAAFNNVSLTQYYQAAQRSHQTRVAQQ